MSCLIHFPDTHHETVCLSEGANLSEELTIINSPVLFGCRTGVCGTCLVEIPEGYGNLIPPTETELEALEVYAFGNPQARLACQINVNCDISLKKIECA